MLEVTFDNFIKLLSQDLTIESIREKNESYKKAIHKIKNGSRVYIWPAGKMGQTVYNELLKNGYNKLNLVDKNTILKEVISPEQLKFENEDVLIIATLRHSREIYNLAQNKKCQNIIMYYDIKELGEITLIIFPEDFYDQCFEELTKHLLNNTERYLNMYFSLEDIKSKKVFLKNMFFRLTYDIRYTFENDKGIQYFDDNIIDYEKFDGAIIDGGAYNGDTLENFLKLNKEFTSYYLFEPDEDLLNVAKKITKDNRIHYINKGLFSSSKILRFNKTAEEDGKFTEQGNIKIEVTSIDEIIKEKVAFIKMDIEGCELEALKGARNIIKQYKPTLAICIYHKPEDYLTIFEYIKSLNKDYKFFIRHYSNYYTETVLYAI